MIGRSRFEISNLVWFLRPLEYSLDDGVGIDALGFAFEVQKHAMAKRAVCDGTDIFARNMHAILEQCANFSANDQGLSAARARAVTHVLHGERMSIRRLRVR